ncbi:kinase-like domain, phloem protein 2-like protein [Tanacetum coccineum]
MSSKLASEDEYRPSPEMASNPKGTYSHAMKYKGLPIKDKKGTVNHDDLAHLKIPLESIVTATNNFAKENFCGEDDIGNHYVGELLWSDELIRIQARRWLNKEKDDEKEQQFWIEISMLYTLKHKNLVSIVGFCDENDELIIVIKLETRFSLNNYLSDTMMLTWVRRLEICTTTKGLFRDGQILGST